MRAFSPELIYSTAVSPVSESAKLQNLRLRDRIAREIFALLLLVRIQQDQSKRLVSQQAVSPNLHALLAHVCVSPSPSFIKNATKHTSESKFLQILSGED